MARTWIVSLTDKERRALRSLLYGIEIGGCFNVAQKREARAFLARLAPKALTKATKSGRK